MRTPLLTTNVLIIEPFIRSGGSILSDLVNSQNDSIQNSSISGLVRGEAKAKLLSETGVNVELFGDLDAGDEIERIASNYDSMRLPQQPRS